MGVFSAQTKDEYDQFLSTNAATVGDSLILNRHGPHKFYLKWEDNFIIETQVLNRVLCKSYLIFKDDAEHIISPLAYCGRLQIFNQLEVRFGQHLIEFLLFASAIGNLARIKGYARGLRPIYATMGLWITPAIIGLIQGNAAGG